MTQEKCNVTLTCDLVNFHFTENCPYRNSVIDREIKNYFIGSDPSDVNCVKNTTDDLLKFSKGLDLFSLLLKVPIWD